MVISEQVKNAVSSQVSNLSLQTVAVKSRLIPCLFHRDNNVAQNLCACLSVGVINAVLAHWKGQNVCFDILVSVLLVQLANTLVVGKGHADLGGSLKVFELEHRVAATAHKHSDACRDLYCLLLVSDYYSDFICHFERPPNLIFFRFHIWRKP